MPLFRVHVIHADLTPQKVDCDTKNPKLAADTVARRLREAGESGFRIGKVKAVRS